MSYTFWKTIAITAFFVAVGAVGIQSNAYAGGNGAHVFKGFPCGAGGLTFNSHSVTTPSGNTNLHCFTH